MRELKEGIAKVLGIQYHEPDTNVVAERWKARYEKEKEHSNSLESDLEASNKMRSMLESDIEKMKHSIPTARNDELVRITTERDIYKQQYETMMKSILERNVG